MKLTDEQIKEMQVALEQATQEPLHADKDEWPGNDNLKHWVMTQYDGIGCYIKYDDARLAANAPEWIRQLLADRQARKEEAKTLSDQLNQAMEVLEWIKDAGTDYQSSNKAASFLSSLSQETEVNHETGWDIGKSQEKA